MTAMFDQNYLTRAMEMTKTGNQFFWEPIDRWHFAAQRDYHIEKYSESLFSALPFFYETRLQVFPVDFNLKAVRFKAPFPNLIMLYHNDMCVWNKAVGRPRTPNGEIDNDGVIKIDFASMLKEPIIEINGIDPQLCNTLRENWNRRKRIAYK